MKHYYIYMESTDRMSTFLELLSGHERFLAGYVYSLIPNAADAEDVLQEVKMALWKNFEQFELGTSFTAWSKTVAFYRVMAFRKKKAVENERLSFSDDCIELLSREFMVSATEASDEVVKLNSCIERLKPAQRKMIDLRYKGDCSIEEVAAEMGKKVDACYRAISRIRLQLRKCLTLT